MAGSTVSAQNVRAACWALDAVGLVVATSILALGYFRKEKHAVATGFLVFAIGEGVMLSGTAGSLEASVPAFAAGTALWSAALLLTSMPREFAIWIRRGRNCRRHSFRYHFRPHFLGSDSDSARSTAAVFRLPATCAHVCRMDLDGVEGRLRPRNPSKEQ